MHIKYLVRNPGLKRRLGNLGKGKGDSIKMSSKEIGCGVFHPAEDIV
jgi:hypothetical protein